MNKFDSKWIVSASLLLFAGICDGKAKASRQPQPAKPNIVIIVADDLGWGDLGYHGSAIKTPNIDKFSESGIQLTRFYTAPICSPTRAGLLTGMYPNRFGIRENVIPPWRDYGLEPSNWLIPEFLEEQGYRHRAIVGKWHLGHSKPEYYPLNQGFTHFYGHLNGAIDYFTHERDGELDWHNDYASCYDKGYTTDLLAGESVRCIKEYSKEGPFFLYVAFNAPHTPLQAKNEDLELYGYDASGPTFSINSGGESSGQGNTRFQTFAAMVTCMDRGIGQILEALEDMGIGDNTLVLFMSDNGADEGSGGGSSGPLNGHKFLEYDGGVRSPAIIRWPARFKSSGEVSQLSGFVDIFPTLCEIIEPGSCADLSFDGISILEVLEGGEKPFDRTFYLGCGALVEGEWKIIRQGQNPKMKLPGDVLFNLIEDPYETTDVSTRNPEVMERLTKKTLAFDTLKPEKVLPPFEEGREGFVPPKEWNLFQLNQVPYWDNSRGLVSDCADPYILNHEGVYYLYGTGGRKGIRVYRSDDLATWSQAAGAKGGYALDSADVWGWHSFWAPEVYFLKGKFYMFLSSMTQLVIAESDSPLGPFVQKLQQPLNPELIKIDSHLFTDDDGKMYLYFVRFLNGNEIWMAEMKDDLTGIREETLTRCFGVTEPWEQTAKEPVARVAEGPFMVKHKDLYYLTYSANHYRSQDYAVGYAFSESPFGPFRKYEGNPILIGDMKNIFGTGHHSIFESTSGQMYMVYHSHKSGSAIQPRTTCLDRCGFEKDENGKPDKLVVYGPTTTPQPVR